MNHIYDENIGFESILPNEIVDFLNSLPSKKNKRRLHYVLMTNAITSFLDEHEQAMAE